MDAMAVDAPDPAAQHPMLVRRHTVAENIALGMPTRFFGPTRKLEGQIRELGERYGLAVDPNAFVWQLSAGSAYSCC